MPNGINYLDIKFPLELENASPKEVDYFWESIAVIQLSTKRGWWGNAHMPKNMQVGSEYAEVGPEGITIDRQFLARKEALAVQACAPLVKMGIATGVEANSSNPYGDRIDTEVYPELIGEVPTVVVGGEYAEQFQAAEEPGIVWQDTVDSELEKQDTLDSETEIQDVK